MDGTPSPPEGGRRRPTHGARGRRISLEEQIEDVGGQGFGRIVDDSADKQSRRMRIQLGLSGGGTDEQEQVAAALLDETDYTPKNLPVKEKVYANPVGLMFNG